MLASTLAPDVTPAMVSNSSAGACSLRVAHVGDGGKLLVGTHRPFDPLKLALLLDLRDPFAEIVPVNWQRVRRRRKRWRRGIADAVFHGCFP
jgi:hypothetical protein